MSNSILFIIKCYTYLIIKTLVYISINNNNKIRIVERKKQKEELPGTNIKSRPSLSKAKNNK